MNFPRINNGVSFKQRDHDVHMGVRLCQDEGFVIPPVFEFGVCAVGEEELGGGEVTGEGGGHEGGAVDVVGCVNRDGLGGEEGEEDFGVGGVNGAVEGCVLGEWFGDEDVRGGAVREGGGEDGEVEAG